MQVKELLDTVVFARRIFAQSFETDKRLTKRESLKKAFELSQLEYDEIEIETALFLLENVKNFENGVQVKE